jgi:hypothetical protein
MAGTVLGKNTETVQSFLDRLKKVKVGNGMLDIAGNPVKPNWEDFVPAQLSYQKPVDNGINSQINDEISNRDDQATGAVLTEANNRQNQKLYQQQQALLRAARKNSVRKLTQAQIAAQAGSNPLHSSVSGGGSTSVSLGAGGSNPTNFHAPGGPGKLVTVSSHGHSFTIASNVAGRFTGFLNALWDKGYHFKSVGGYSNRNIAGTGTRSAHSYGYAIDVDPSTNGVYYDGNNHVYALPKSVGALAAKYGLNWGGNWRHKKDYMHFSVTAPNGAE